MRRLLFFHTKHRNGRHSYGDKMMWDFTMHESCMILPFCFILFLSYLRLFDTSYRNPSFIFAIFKIYRFFCDALYP